MMYKTGENHNADVVKPGTEMDWNVYYVNVSI